MITFIIGLILGIVAGALFARRNLSKVDQAVVSAKEAAAKVQEKVRKE